jgi:hypothetical protein
MLGHENLYDDIINDIENEDKCIIYGIKNCGIPIKNMFVNISGLNFFVIFSTIDKKK